MKSKIAIILVSILTIFLPIRNEHNWKGHLIHWDQWGYNVYLPALITYHDVDSMNFHRKMQQRYHFTPGNDTIGLYPMPNGKQLTKYPVGVAVHQAPLFLVAQMVANNTKGIDTDGYSLPYQYSIIFSTILWMLIGLILLRSVLRQYYDDGVVAIVLLLIPLGTNMFFYTIYFTGMGHPYAFFQYAWVLYLTDKLHRNYHKKYIYLLGLALGLITITRPTNIVAALVPALWGVYNWPTLKHKLQANLNAQRIGHMTIAGVIFMAVVSIQLCYWKLVTGSWIYYSYQQEGFVWDKPAIIKGLFSFRKGWFVYTPLALFMVAGLLFFYRKNKQYFFAISVFMAVNTYVIFCWWNWWYGGGFGARAMIESMAFLSMPFAAVISYIMQRKLAIRIGMGVLATILVMLNVFQSYQLSKNVLDYDRMTFEAYRATLFKTKRPDNMNDLLLTPDDFYIEVQSRTKGPKE